MKLKTLFASLITSTSALGLFVVPLPRTASASSITLYISAIAGYVGIMLLLWFLILGTRGVMKPFTKDMSIVNSIHKFLGKYAALLIFLHPLFITISYGESWLYSFLPDISTEFEKTVTFGRIAFGILLIIWVSSALLRSKMGYRPWKYLHLLAYASLPFALLHIPDTGSTFAHAVAAKIYFFIVLIGFGIFTLLRLRSSLNFNKFYYTVLSNKQIADKTYLLTLRSDALGEVLPRPGQYIYLKTGWFSEEHPFSVLAHDEDKKELYIAYKVYGAFTKAMAALTSGEQVLINGSFGTFTHEIDAHPDRPVVYIAGGIGIAPFVSRLLQQSESREQWLFYANRSRDTAAFLPTFEKTLGSHLVSILSNSSDVHSGRSARNAGFIESFSAHLTDPTRYDYYLCGPGPLMDSATTALVRLGVDPATIRREAFSY